MTLCRWCFTRLGPDQADWCSELCREEDESERGNRRHKPLVFPRMPWISGDRFE